MSRSRNTDPSWVRVARFVGRRPEAAGARSCWDVLSCEDVNWFTWPNVNHSNKPVKRAFHSVERAKVRDLMVHEDFDKIEQVRKDWFF